MNNNRCICCGDTIPEGKQVCDNCEQNTKTYLNNETMKKFNITIKLRGDNVYDLYIDDKWIASRGSCENILDEVRNEVKKSLYEK
jgi:predicted nucleic acid-binding Zn ribbon protein